MLPIYMKEYQNSQINEILTPNVDEALGVIYQKGLGVEQSDKEAFEWYSKAAEQGFAPAQNNLGRIYTEGQWVTKNYEEAVKWYRKAAEQGDAIAQHNLGVMYQKGLGVEQSDKEAVKCYRKAAKQGYAFAQHNLRLMYKKGRGVDKSDANTRQEDPRIPEVRAPENSPQEEIRGDSAKIVQLEEERKRWQIIWDSEHLKEYQNHIERLNIQITELQNAEEVYYDIIFEEDDEEEEEESDYDNEDEGEGED